MAKKSDNKGIIGWFFVVLLLLAIAMGAALFLYSGWTNIAAVQEDLDGRRQVLQDMQQGDGGLAAEIEALNRKIAQAEKQNDTLEYEIQAANSKAEEYAEKFGELSG